MNLTYELPTAKGGIVSFLKVLSVILGGVLLSTAAFIAAVLLFQVELSSITQSLLLPIVTIIQGAAFTISGLVYVKYIDSIDWSSTYSIPDKEDILFVLYGVVGLFLAAISFSFILEVINVQSADNQISEIGAQNPDIMLLMIPIAILVIGVYEEFIFRGIAHETFRPLFGSGGAIIISSVLFSLVHVTSLVGSGVVPTLVILFVLGTILGYLYERTNNLIVPILVHGIYDAILFATLYLSQFDTSIPEVVLSII